MKDRVAVDVYRFKSYRIFLRASYDALKARSPKFSYRRWAAVVGLESPNYPKLVIDGKRNLTVANIHRFSKALKLTPTESEVFESLVLLEQATTPAERTFYRRRLMALRAARPDAPAERHIRDRMLTHELFPAGILMLNDLRRADAEGALRKRLGLSGELARQIIEFALENHMVVDRAGVLAQNDAHVVFNSPYTPKLQRVFLRRQLQRSVAAFDSDYERGAKFYATTMTCTKEGALEQQERIKALIAATAAHSSDSAQDDLVQMNVQLFKLT